ncbi:hypothetical protein AYO44_09310 [Planctomycetaceae bacterium SCGC AG-212-F19]|nr:hypothetical protein AYO44_09310 [Planctomycetaceae bacterium SCGC AG-212-F19]
MTEEEWLGTDSPLAMLAFLFPKGALPKVSLRKGHLFGCAVCRRIWNLLTDVRSQQAVEYIEAVADGRNRQRFGSGNAMLDAARDASRNAPSMTGRKAAEAAYALVVVEVEFWEVLGHVIIGAMNAVAPRGPNGVTDIERYHQEIAAHTALFRDIFGNPFRPIALDHTWQTANVLALAHAIYEERAFDRLPILADALEDAGCTNQDILGHCRGQGPHVRGCWVVDMVLGKE